MFSEYTNHPEGFGRVMSETYKSDLECRCSGGMNV